MLGIDGGPLPPGARSALADAEVIAGAARHLAAAVPAAGAETIEMGPRRAGARPRSPAAARVVLASGDPGFFGIVRLLRERGCAPDGAARRVSASRPPFARLGRPWDDARRGQRARPRAAARRSTSAAPAPRRAVLTAPGAGPAEIGAGLAGWPRTLVVAEDLGGPRGAARPR